MSLYNIVNGYSWGCVLILPMLGRKADEYPRFRDCLVSPGNNILVYTRVGGANRSCGFGEEFMYRDPNFIRTYDDGRDPTYGYYEFKVPEEWEADFKIVVENGDLQATSLKYKQLIREHYPDIGSKIFPECEVLSSDGN